jgi:hypothetical protein
MHVKEPDLALHCIDRALGNCASAKMKLGLHLLEQRLALAAVRAAAGCSNNAAGLGQGPDAVHAEKRRMLQPHYSRIRELHFHEARGLNQGRHLLQSRVGRGASRPRAVGQRRHCRERVALTTCKQ